jgi:uncharacterized membrane protein
MSALIAGLVVFFAAHSVGLVAPAWRARQIARVGLRPWKLAYSAISVAGLALIVWGFGMARADAIVVWQPPVWAVVVSLLFALYLHGPLIGVRPFG